MTCYPIKCLGISLQCDNLPLVAVDYLVYNGCSCFCSFALPLGIGDRMRSLIVGLPELFYLQLTLVISTLLISNNRLSRSENLVPA